MRPVTQPDRYGIPLPPTPTTPCRSCGDPVLGTRAGYVELCPACKAKQPEVDAEAPPREYAYRHGKAALRAWVATCHRYRGLRALWPERDRVDGGEGSRKPENLAQAAIVGGIVDAAVPDEEERDVLACWAVGIFDPPGKYDLPGPVTWEMAASALGYGRAPKRAQTMIGVLCARVYGALRARGIVPPRECEQTTEASVYTKGDVIAYGWGGIADALAEMGIRPGGRTSTVTPKTLRRWVTDRGLPVIEGKPVRAEVAALQAWARSGRGAEATGEGKAA